MFYDKFIELCKRKGVSRSKACIDCDVSRTAWNKWLNGATPNGATVNKFADYFGVTADYLLGTEKEKTPTPEGEREDSDRAAMVAFFRGADIPDEEMDEYWEDAKDYINFKMKQKKDEE